MRSERPDHQNHEPQWGALGCLLIVVAVLLALAGVWLFGGGPG